MHGRWEREDGDGDKWQEDESNKQKTPRTRLERQRGKDWAQSQLFDELEPVI